MRKLCSLVIFISIFISSLGRVYAQPAFKSVEGLVVDTTGLGLKGVSVRLVSDQDTLSTTTNMEGFYKLSNISGKHFNITYSMLGYQIINKSISTKPFIKQIFLPKLILSTQTNVLPEIRVERVIPIVQRGDTTQFNMRAFSFPDRSLLEEALKQLPGFQVLRDGTTFYNGQIITGVQVEGRKFFGGDLLTATKNLPSEFVKQIEVINDYGDFSQEKGIKKSEPEKIINIILEDNRKKITFGQGTLGGGTRDRYLGSLGLNKFNDGQELSVVASVNNTNTSLFAFGSPNGAGGRSLNLGDMGDYSDQSDGLNKLSSIGITFSDNIAENVTISGGYNYQSKNNLTEGNSLLTSSYQGYRIHRFEDYKNNLNDKFHKLYFEINSKFKNQDILKIVPTFSYNKSYNYNLKTSDLRNYKIRDFGDRQDSAINNNPTAELTMVYSKYFEKPGRKLIGDVKFNFQSLDKDESITENYISFDSTGVEPIINQFDQKQYVDSKNDVKTIKTSVSYVEPFFDHSLLEISHEMDLTDIEALRSVRSPFGYVDSLAVEYAYQFKSFKTGLNYQYEPNSKFRINMGFSVQPVNLRGRVKGITEDYEYNNVNLVPSSSAKYKFNNDLDMQISYLGKNIQPNFLHISPVRDNSNSRNIIVGNPSLKAEFYNRFSTTLRKFVTSKGQYFETNFAYTFIANKIVSSKTSLSNETVQETTFENTDGYFDMKWYYLFNTPFINDDFQLDISANLDYYHNLSYINKIKSNTEQVLFNQSLQLRYNWNEYFESVFNSNYFLNRATYQLPFENKIAAHSFLLSLGGKGYLSDRLMFGAEMSQKFYNGYVSELSDVNPTIINTYVEYSFLKNNLALLRLQCFDLMDQNKNVGVLTEYVGNDVFESRNNRLGRYFMLTLNIRLQSYPNKK